MRACTTCYEFKVDSDFTKKKSGRDGLNASCRVCTRKRSKKHYQDRPDYYAEKRAARERQMRQLITKLKDMPCADCGQRYPYYVMDFDHRDPSVKEANVSSMAKTGSKRRILEEVAKCDVVCANCHRIRTYKAS